MKNNSKRVLMIAVAAGGMLALSIALIMTFLDWRLNPGGLFHHAGRTRWDIVWATLFSWFWPVFLAILVIAVPVGLWLTRSR